MRNQYLTREQMETLWGKVFFDECCTTALAITGYDAVNDVLAVAIGRILLKAQHQPAPEGSHLPGPGFVSG